MRPGQQRKPAMTQTPKADQEVTPKQTVVRKERVPLGTHRLKLSAPLREGYHRRWVNDVPGRIMAFEAAGYQFVIKEAAPIIGEGHDLSQSEGVGSRVSYYVGTQETGQPMMAYLMEIPQEWYDEDQAVKLGKIKETEAAMRTGEDGQGRPGVDGRYIPREGIKIDKR
jgi:hypothetical protein